MKNKHAGSTDQFLAGGGEMGKLMREKDWTKTSLGAPELWPQSLRTALSIILNSKFPMFLFWGEELICFYNDAYRPSLGKEGKHPSILGMQGEKAWAEVWHIIQPLIAQVLAGGEGTWSEDQLIPIYRNGKIEDVYWTFSYSPVNDETGKPAGVLVTCFETTDKVLAFTKLQEREKRLGFLLEQGEQLQKISTQLIQLENVDELYRQVLQAAVALMRSDCASMQMFNPQTNQLDLLASYGFHPESEKHWRIVYTDSPTACGDAMRSITRTVVTDIETVDALKGTEDLRHFHLSHIRSIQSTPLISREGKFVGMISTHWSKVYQPSEESLQLIDVLARQAADLIERKNAEERIKENEKRYRELSLSLEEKVARRTVELNDKNIDLEKMNKELQSFAYISSHDLQEPLRKIQTFSARIMDKDQQNLSDAGKNYFKRMQDSVLRMQTLIDDLLAYSRTSTADRKLEKTDLNKIVEEIKSDLKEELKQKHATIETTGLGEVSVIPFQFRQLLSNLLGNSLKFSDPARPPHIKIKSEIAKGAEFENPALNDKTNYCHISISDNGIGFEQRFHLKIFELFQRLHGRHEYSGTGIGLAIVKKIVENHEGLITASGEPDKGATFDIYLPVN